MTRRMMRARRLRAGICPHTEENGFDSIKILHNNHFAYDKYGICGTRGWINDNSEPADAKVLAREAGRLETSLCSAEAAGLEPIVFLHYPPIYGT